MSNDIRKHLWSGLILGLFGSVTIAILALDVHLPPPSISSMDSFSGTVSSVSYDERRKRWWVKADNSSDSRKFYVLRKDCDDLGQELQVGDNLEAKLHRRFWYFGNIRGWEISSGARNVVTMDDSKLRQVGNLNDLAFVAGLSFPLLSIGFAWMFYLGERKEQRRDT